jgi:hypothetical protein
MSNAQATTEVSAAEAARMAGRQQRQRDAVISAFERCDCDLGCNRCDPPPADWLRPVIGNGPMRNK